VRGALGFLDPSGRTFDGDGLGAIGRLADEVAGKLAAVAAAP
jgi:hypothetical protein